jgi:hypothetical protein
MPSGQVTQVCDLLPQKVQKRYGRSSALIARRSSMALLLIRLSGPQLHHGVRHGLLLIARSIARR